MGCGACWDEPVSLPHPILDLGGETRYALGDPSADSYLAFVAGRFRPNTLRAAAQREAFWTEFLSGLRQRGLTGGRRPEC